jgi:hypothetical protein
MSESLRYTPSIVPACFNLEWRKQRSAFATRAVTIARASVGYPSHRLFTRGSREAEEERVRAGQLSELRRGIGIVAMKLGAEPKNPASWLAYGYAYQEDAKVIIGSLQALPDHGRVLPEVAYALLGQYDAQKEVADPLNALRILYEGDFAEPLQHTKQARENGSPMVQSSRNPDDPDHNTVMAYRHALLIDFLQYPAPPTQSA